MSDSLQRLAQLNFGLDLNGALREVSGLDLDANGVAQSLYGSDVNGAHEELVTLLGGRNLTLDGSSGTYISTPDSAALSIAGDLDLRFEGSTFDDGNRAIVAKWLTTGDQRSYILQLGAFGAYAFTTSADGVAALSNNTANFQDVVNDNWSIRVTFDADDGAGNRVATYYRGGLSNSSTIDGATTVVETVTTAGTTTIFDSTADLTIGAQGDGTSNVAQLEVLRMELYDGIDGTLVADPDFRFLAPGTTSFSDSVGNTWTLNGNAAVT